ncbi:hypothetical protein PJP10_32075, partial [Mycobacterium kansasii]
VTSLQEKGFLATKLLATKFFFIAKTHFLQRKKISLLKITFSSEIVHSSLKDTFSNENLRC